MDGNLEEWLNFLINIDYSPFNIIANHHIFFAYFRSVAGLLPLFSQKVAIFLYFAVR